MAWACRRRRSGTITATGSMAPERPEEGEQEEEEEPVAKRLKKTAVMVDKAAAAAVSERQGPSKFVGVSWNKRDRKWGAYINHEGNRQHLGSFDDEHEAARAVDTAARRLWCGDAHGRRAGNGTNWHRLNFPTAGEVKRAHKRGALLTQEDKAAAAAASERQGPSKFVGVSWVKEDRKWRAQIRHDGGIRALGRFGDEREAAQVFDTAARRLRGEDAHGGRAAGGGNWWRLNFPTDSEMKWAKARGALLPVEDKAATAAASERQ